MPVYTKSVLKSTKADTTVVGMVLLGVLGMQFRVVDLRVVLNLNRSLTNSNSNTMTLSPLCTTLNLKYKRSSAFAVFPSGTRSQNATGSAT